MNKHNPFSFRKNNIQNISILNRLYLLFPLILLISCSNQQKNKINPPIKPIPYTEAELLSQDIRDTYEGDYLRRVAFPLGGIGTGCISLSGTGKLVNWEIFNNPNKGFQPRYSFLSLWAQTEDDDPVFKVLEGQLTERLDGPMYITQQMWYGGNGLGPQQTQGAGLPRFRHCQFVGRFPFAKVILTDENVPVEVEIEGWSPFIPGDDRNTSLPVAILSVTLKNTTNKDVNISLGINVQNRVGSINEILREKDFYALYMHDGEPGGKSMFVASPEPALTWQTNWVGDNIWTALENFVRSFVRTGQFQDSGAPIVANQPVEKYVGTSTREGSDRRSSIGNDKVGSLGFQYSLSPYEQKTVPLIIGWYFPIFDTAEPDELATGYSSWRNYYAEQWPSGLEVARYVVTNLEQLLKRTRQFQHHFFSSTLPGVVVEAISSQLSVLRSPTIIRYPDGTLYGWEGCAIAKRLGPGTANHVWNFQHAIPFLFPAVQRSILENFYLNGFRESDGAVQYRMPLGPGAKAADQSMKEVYGKTTNFFTAADGQLGMVCQVYREWQICGNDDWLRQLWPMVKKSLEYAWTEWDKDQDGLLEGSHHNTLDLNYSTPEPSCGSLYQAALLAGEQMACYLGEEKSAKQFRRVYESGKKLTDEKLFNGEYYHQMLPATGDYQLGNGCISEQVHGQLYSRMLGLEAVFNHDNIHKALGALFKYNFQENFYDFVNTYRAYSVGEDQGLVISTWPLGGRPEKPLLYADETMTGFEYQVAGNLLYDEYILEGLSVLKAIRDRHDGKKRNPYCEFEWGNHYARAMANYSSLLALSGFRYSALERVVWLNPQVYQENFTTFFSVDGAWGIISQKMKNNILSATIDVAEGQLLIRKLVLNPGDEASVATIKSDNTISCSVINDNENVIIEFDNIIKISPDQPVELIVQ